MSPATTAKPDAKALDRRRATLDQRQLTGGEVVCGSIYSSDQSQLGGGSLLYCAAGDICAASSTYWDCIASPGGTIRTTCLDKSATCAGFACPTDAIICDVYSTYCVTWIVESSLTGYGCSTSPFTVNVSPLNLVQYTPTASPTPTASSTLTASPTSPTSSLALQTNTSTSGLGSSNTLPATSSSASPSNLSSSLSTGDKVDIGVGVTFGALLVTTVLLTIFFRKKLFAWLKGRQRETPLPSSTRGKSGLPNMSSGTPQVPAELRAPLTLRQHGLEQHRLPHELADNQGVAQELPAVDLPWQTTRDG